jgi:hypothetical protein
VSGLIESIDKTGITRFFKILDQFLEDREENTLAVDEIRAQDLNGSGSV